jgi:hypothetical protein
MGVCTHIDGFDFISTTEKDSEDTGLRVMPATKEEVQSAEPVFELHQGKCNHGIETTMDVDAYSANS